MATEDVHLEGLALVEKKLVKAYATTIIGGIHTYANVKPERLTRYVEIEITLREIAILK